MAREYQRKLEELFRAADTDGDDSLSAEEFTRAMSLPSVQRYMQVLEVKIQDCRPLFEILDDGDGQITISEFCKGLMQLKGRAGDFIDLKKYGRESFESDQTARESLKKLCNLRPVVRNGRNRRGARV